MTKTKKILIIGASGFVGREILKAFVKNKGEFNIYTLENLSRVPDSPAVTKVKGSLFKAAQIIEKLQPHIIIHAARISGQRYKYLGRKRAALMGQIANHRICKKVLRLNIPLLYVSGSLMYGSHGQTAVTEDFAANPISYAIDYQKAEWPFLKGLRKGRIMICRPGWIFGPNSWFRIFFEDIITADNYVPQYGDGQNTMSIIHGQDLGRLIKEYALNAPYANIYNMISPATGSHKKFVTELAQLYKKEIKYFSKEEITEKYGAIVCDALTCDINLATNYKKIIKSFSFEYKNFSDLLEK